MTEPAPPADPTPAVPPEPVAAPAAPAAPAEPAAATPAPVLAAEPAPSAPTATTNSSPVLVRSVSVDRFDPSVPGVEVITAAGTRIPREQLAAVQNAAERSGIHLDVEETP